MHASLIVLGVFGYKGERKTQAERGMELDNPTCTDQSTPCIPYSHNEINSNGKTRSGCSLRPRKTEN